MFEALPVVIPTLRDVARGTLRPAATDASELADAHTAAILLDAAAPDTRVLGNLYDELELYLQAAHISTLRLHRRGRSTVAQMLDILASVTLLRSHGCRRVILIVAASGEILPWEQSRAETLASLLDLIRRHHAGSARELISAIEDLVKTIRVVADSVVGVATLLVAPSGALPATRRSPTAPSHTPPSRRQPRAVVPAPSPAARSLRAMALALSRDDAQEQARAVSQIYLWCRSLASQAATPSHAPAHARAPDDSAALESLERSSVIASLRDVGTEFRGALEWLDRQWDELVAEQSREEPHSAARALAAASLPPAQGPRSTSLAASRAAWDYLDSAMRLKWLELCRQTFSPVSGLTTTARYAK